MTTGSGEHTRAIGKINVKRHEPRCGLLQEPAERLVGLRSASMDRSTTVGPWGRDAGRWLR